MWPPVITLRVLNGTFQLQAQQDDFSSIQGGSNMTGTVCV